MKAYLNDLNTTSYRIVASATTTCIICVMLMVAMLFFGWTPGALQLKVLYAIGILLSVMMGIDVAQFGVKRWTDVNFQNARSAGGPTVTNADNVTQLAPGSKGKINGVEYEVSSGDIRKDLGLPPTPIPTSPPTLTVMKDD